MDLSNGTLEQTATDVDLGRGLEFTRHYSSGRSDFQAGSIGRNWRHSLDWRLEYKVVERTRLTIERATVRRPFAKPIVFAQFTRLNAQGQPVSTEPWSSGPNGAGSLSRAGNDPNYTYTYTDDYGTRVVFRQASALPTFDLVEMQQPGAPQITVSKDPTGSPTTFKGASGCLIVGSNTSGQVTSVSSVYGATCSAATQQTWVYEYSPAGECLSTVTGPNPGTSGGDMVWTYSYTGGCSGLMTEVQRGVEGVTSVLSHWSILGARATSASEPALDQDLCFAYSTAADSTVTTTICEAPSSGTGCPCAQNSPTRLATYTSKNGRISATSSDSVGGPGIDLPYRSATFTPAPAEFGDAQEGLRDTTTDLNCVSTRYVDYDEKGRPKSVQEGWKDTNANCAIDGAETYTRKRDYIYHPRLHAPLQVSERSVINPSATRSIVISYDDPSIPGTLLTDLLYSRTETGQTLDVAGGLQLTFGKTDYEYTPDALLSKIKGPRPQQLTEIDYDSTYRSRSAIRRYIDATNLNLGYLQWTFDDFDPQGNPRRVTDPNGRETLFTYDSRNRVRTAKPPAEGATGDTTVFFTYDVDDNLIEVGFPGPVILKMAYDPKGNLFDLAEWKPGDQEGSAKNRIVYEYQKGRVTLEVVYNGTYPPPANTDQLAADGKLLRDLRFMPYTGNGPPGSNGRLWKALNPLFAGGSVFSELAYDTKGNLKDVTDENLRRDTLIVDALDRLMEIQQIRSGLPTLKTRFTYDSLSNVTAVTAAADTNPRTTTLTHDDFGNLVESISPDTGRTRFLYDVAGNLVRKVENAPASGTAGARITNYTYDGLNRLKLIDLPNDPDWIFAYDTDAAKNTKGRLASVTNGIVTTRFSYTKRGDVLLDQTTLDGLTYTVTYGYDFAGNRTTVIPPDNTPIATFFTGLRPSGIMVDNNTYQRVLGIEWFPFGPWKRAAFPKFESPGGNAVVSTRTVNKRGQIAGIGVTIAGATVLNRFYSYQEDWDKGPNLDKVDDQLDDSEDRSYRYDPFDRLAEARDRDGALLHGYEYDEFGNRMVKRTAAAVTNYGYEPGKNRIASTSGAEPRFYAHDAYGNRIYAGATPFSGTPSMLYDESNRLVLVRDPLTLDNRGAYTYDAFGRRVRRADAVRQKAFVYLYDTDGHLVQEIEKKAYANDLARTYVYLSDDLVGLVDRVAEIGTAAFWPSFSFGAPDLRSPIFAIVAVALGGGLLLLLAQRHPVGAATATGALLAVFTCAGTGRPPPEFSWVHTDPLGTPLAVTSAPQNTPSLVVWRAKYEPFGKATVNQDPDGNSFPFELNVRFPGQYEDAETASYYNTFRTYDPQTGRYLEADPIGLAGGTNIYAYAASDPINGADPTGESVIVNLSSKPVKTSENRANGQVVFDVPPVGISGGIFDGPDTLIAEDGSVIKIPDSQVIIVTDEESQTSFDQESVDAVDRFPIRIPYPLFRPRLIPDPVEEFGPFYRPDGSPFEFPRTAPPCK